jgi:GNAT superfamily N-acetyltransferase
MEFEVAPIAESHIAGYRAAFDAVAREARYLGRTNAPPMEVATEWVRGNIKRNIPQFVALVQNRVIGWCDINPERADTMAHGGVLGISVVDGFRGHGIGSALMRATLDAARAASATICFLWRC